MDMDCRRIRMEGKKKHALHRVARGWPVEGVFFVSLLEVTPDRVIFECDVGMFEIIVSNISQ